MPSRMSSAIICRPSISGDLDVVASCHFDLPVTSDIIQIEPPSERECLRLAKQRVKIHFSNRGKVELNGHILFYSVSVGEPCTLVFICVGESALGFDDAQQFLDSLQSVVLSDAQTTMLIPTVEPRALQAHLDQPINSLMMAQNTATGSQQQKMDSLREQVEVVKSQMSQNVAALMERGDRLENIEGRTEALHESSAQFKTTAHRVQRHMCLKNAKWTAISAVAILIGLTILILIILSACGVFDHKK